MEEDEGNKRENGRGETKNNRERNETREGERMTGMEDGREKKRE